MAPTSTPAQRKLAGSIGGLTRWSRVHGDAARREQTTPARAGLYRKWEQQADPEGVLSPEDLAAAVDRLKLAHYRRMALKSAQSRRRAA